MKMVLIAPRKYVQGRGVIAEAGSYLAMLGKKPLLVWDATVKGIIGDALLSSATAAGLEPIDADFQGEVTKEEAGRLGQMARDQGADIAVGIGGGKAIDVAKAVTFDVGTKLMTIPTIAATDAPTSAASVWYDADSNFIEFNCWPFNPDIVLVDTQVIANGPAKAFASGMGDALATWVEAEASYKTRGTTLAGGVSTRAAMAIARLGYDTLLEYGVDALRAVAQNLVTPAVEKVVEANVLHSGLGFESGGLATAHMVANPLSNFPECKHLMHGEKVGFGVVTQMCMDEDTDVEEMYEVVDFMIAIGLPVTFEDLNLKGATRDQMRVVAEICASEGSLCHNHAFKVTEEGALDAIFAADELGRRRKAAAGIE